MVLIGLTENSSSYIILERLHVRLPNTASDKWKCDDVPKLVGNETQTASKGQAK
jgi:hypothetical protein